MIFAFDSKATAAALLDLNQRCGGIQNGENTIKDSLNFLLINIIFHKSRQVFIVLMKVCPLLPLAMILVNDNGAANK